MIPAPDVELAHRALQALGRRASTLAVAESLTGGLLAATVVSVPGASGSFRGGVVAYATDLKATLLGVPLDLLDRCGPVHRDTAAAMAEGVRTRLHADVGVATTGVAGPDPQGGRAVGTVFVAVCAGNSVLVEEHVFPGGRAAIRGAATTAALRLLVQALEGGHDREGATTP